MVLNREKEGKVQHGVWLYPGPLGCINYQGDGEIAAYAFYLPNGAVGRGTAHLDFDCHKVVAGVAYHW